MPARVGHRAGVYVPGLADCVFDLVGDRPKGGGTSTDLEGLPEFGCRFYNDTGGSLTKGTLVYVSGYSTKRARTVTKSQAGVSIAEWVVAETTANGAFGYLVKAAALIADLDTSGSSVGSLVYASAATAGALTLTASAQRVGRVGSVSASGGDGVVLFDLWATGASSVGGSLNILDTGTLTFGTGGTDVVVTADGTDAVVTGTGDVVFVDNMDLQIGTGKDLKIVHNGTDTLIAGANGDIVIDNTDTNDVIILRVGTDTTATGVEVRNNSDVAMWNFRPTSATAGSLKGADTSALVFGDGDDIAIAWDATKLAVTQAAANSAIHLGVDGAGIDLVMYGDTASANITWDQSADKLILSGVASVQGLRTSSSTAAAITGATVLTLADSGGVFSVSQAAAYDIDLPSPTTGPGCRYTFYLTGPAANAVTITVLGGAATFVGTIVNDVTSVIPATGSTLTFASGAAALGDTIEIISISTTLYLVRAVTSAAGGITIA